VISPARELSGPIHGTEQSDATTLPQEPLIEEEGAHVPTLERDIEPIIEHLYTARSLGNTLSWGDQKILEPVDEVVNIQEISYNRKRKVLMRRTFKKRKLTLDSTFFITTEETLFDT